LAAPWIRGNAFAGGDRFDRVILEGLYSSDIILAASMIASVEAVSLQGSYTYTITLQDGAFSNEITDTAFIGQP
jgi:hypothetical protein